jgi:hypothetical protein
MHERPVSVHVASHCQRLCQRAHARSHLHLHTAMGTKLGDSPATAVRSTLAVQSLCITCSPSNPTCVAHQLLSCAIWPFTDSSYSLLLPCTTIQHNSHLLTPVGYLPAHTSPCRCRRASQCVLTGRRGCMCLACLTSCCCLRCQPFTGSLPDGQALNFFCSQPLARVMPAYL